MILDALIDLRKVDEQVALSIEPKPSLARCRFRHDTLSPLGAWLHTHISEHGNECEILPRLFTSEISLAMRFVRFLNPSLEEYDGRKSCRFILRQGDNCEWNVEARSPFLTSYNKPAFATSQSLPEAICRAALDAISRNGTEL